MKFWSNCPYCGKKLSKLNRFLLDYGYNNPCNHCYELIISSEPKPFLEEIEKVKIEPFAIRETLKKMENGKLRFLFTVWPNTLGDFHEKELTKRQKRIAEGVLKAGFLYVKEKTQYYQKIKYFYQKLKYFKFVEIKSYSVYGVDPTIPIQKLQGYREAKKDARLLKNLADYCVKVIFHFNDVLKSLILISTPIFALEKVVGYALHWSGVLDFPIPSQVIYGRISDSIINGYSKFGFASVNIPPPENLKISYSQEELFIKTLDDIIHSSYIRTQMQRMYKHLRLNSLTGEELIDRLNQNKKLIKKMKLILHRGQYKVEWVFRKLKAFSNVDVSVICLPLGKETIFYLSTYNSSPNISLKSIDALKEALENISKPLALLS